MLTLTIKYGGRVDLIQNERKIGTIYAGKMGQNDVKLTFDLPGIAILRGEVADRKPKTHDDTLEDK